MHGTMNFTSPNNISKWQMVFNLAFKGIMSYEKKAEMCDRHVAYTCLCMSSLKYTSAAVRFL
jgi:hypothetical protein